MVGSNLKIGDIVYCNTEWHIGEKCEILTKQVYYSDDKYYEVHSVDNYGTFSCNNKNIFANKNEAIGAYNENRNIKKENYKSNISTISDLIKFAVKNMYCEEYTDYPAIEVVKDKAKELLGVEFEEE